MKKLVNWNRLQSLCSWAFAERRIDFEQQYEQTKAIWTRIGGFYDNSISRTKQMVIALSQYAETGQKLIPGVVKSTCKEADFGTYWTCAILRYSLLHIWWIWWLPFLSFFIDMHKTIYYTIKWTGKTINDISYLVRNKDKALNSIILKTKLQIANIYIGQAIKRDFKADAFLGWCGWFLTGKQPRFEFWRQPWELEISWFIRHSSAELL